MNDLRFAFRMLLKAPGFTAVALLTLALGVGVNTSMFSAIQATTFRPLGFSEPDGLVRVFSTSPNSRRGPHSTPDFLDYQAQNKVFERMVALDPRPFSLAEPGQAAERVRGLRASPGLFPMLRVAPELGRVFREDEAQAGRDEVVILSHRLWLRRFAGETNLLGRTLRLDGEPVTVVGVMPEGFDDPRVAGRVDVWRPMVFTDAHYPNRGNHWLQSVARLKPGATLAQAQAEMDTIAARLAQAYPDSNSEGGVRLAPLSKAGRKGTADGLAAHGARRVRAADRLREPGQSAIGPHGLPGERTGHSRGARGRPEATAGAVAYREFGDRRFRRPPRPDFGRVG